MVIRVFPGDRMTGPRLALLKSYSSRMVFVCLAATGLASGDQARPLFALGVDDHEYPAECIDAEGDKALLTSGVWVFKGESHRITQRLLGMSEADAMFAQVRLGFGRVELDRRA